MVIYHVLEYAKNYKCKLCKDDEKFSNNKAVQDKLRISLPYSYRIEINLNLYTRSQYTPLSCILEHMTI